MKKILLVIILLTTISASATEAPNPFYKAEALKAYPANDIDNLAYNCVTKKYGHMDDYSLQGDNAPSIEYVEAGYQGIYDYYYTEKYQVIGNNDLPNGFFIIIQGVAKADLSTYPLLHQFNVTSAETSSGEQCNIVGTEFRR